MLESLIGFILVLTSGLFGKSVLIEEQPSLKISLHHLEAYSDALGVCAFTCGLLGLYHSLSTGFALTYTPIYWLAWTSSNLLAFIMGLCLSFEIVMTYTMKVSLRLCQGLQALKLWSETQMFGLLWLGMMLGTWRLLWPWLS